MGLATVSLDTVPEVVEVPLIGQQVSDRVPTLRNHSLHQVRPLFSYLLSDPPVPVLIYFTAQIVEAVTAPAG